MYSSFSLIKLTNMFQGLTLVLFLYKAHTEMRRVQVLGETQAAAKCIFLVGDLLHHFLECKKIAT